jgi:hypothetical protein
MCMVFFLPNNLLSYNLLFMFMYIDLDSTSDLASKSDVSFAWIVDQITWGCFLVPSVTNYLPRF